MSEPDEEIAAEKPVSTTTVLGVTTELFRHPLDTMIWRWHWKSALLTSLLRAPIFFAAYLAQKQGLWVAFGAMIAQFIFRALFGGVNGAIIQSYSRVEPPWHAVLTIPLILATYSHVVEYIVQSVYDSVVGTQAKGRAIQLSILISVISAVFNLFAMRRGALLVKDESGQSIWRDLWRMPWLALEFISFPLIWTWRKSKKRAEQ